MFIKREHYYFKQIDKIAIVGFISSLSSVIIVTIWAIYLNSILRNNSYTGYLVSFFTIISTLSYILISPLIQKGNKGVLYFSSIILYSLALFLFSITSNIYTIILLGTFISILISIRVTSFGLIVSDKSKKQSLSKNEGKIYALSNFALIIGPLISGLILARYGVKAVFIVAAIFLSIAAFIFREFKITDNRIQKKINKNPIKIMSEFFTEKNTVVCYILRGAIGFWKTLLYLFIPLLIIKYGYSGKYVGYFLFAAAIPLILLEYSFGKLAGKKGFRKIFFIGYLIIGGITLLCFFVKDLFLILALLILASVGVSMIEPTTEAYFFDIIPKNKRGKYYGIYSTAFETSYAMASFSGGLVLSFLDFKFLFILFGIIALLSAFVSLKIKEVIESRKN